MMELLEHHLSEYGLSCANMIKSRIYTFLLSRREFNKWIPIHNQLYLLSVFDTVGKGAIEDDPLKKSALPRIYSTSFKCIENIQYKHYKSLFMNNCFQGYRTPKFQAHV